MSNDFDFKGVACKILPLLTEIPATRDDDRLLLVEIWMRESNAMSVGDFFHEMLKGKLTHPESITRMRRKIQETHPKLRGEKWDVRHRMEGAICEQLTFFDKW